MSRRNATTMAPMNLVSQLLGLPLFPNFPRLPKELRDEIWEYAVSESRIVPLRRRRLRQEGEVIEGNDRDQGLWGFKCDLPPPSILFVNREANAAASRLYTTAPKAFPCVRYNHTSVPETCIDFARDILYLDGDWTLQIYYRPSEVEMAEREKVRHLAMLYVKDDDPCFVEELAGRPSRSENELWLAQYLAYFPNLETVTVVLEHVEWPKYEEGFTSEEVATLAFAQPNLEMDVQPIDVNAAFEILENKNDALGRAAIPNHPRWLSLDCELLIQRRLECVRGQYVPAAEWKMPEIRQRVMLTADLKAILEKNMKAY